MEPKLHKGNGSRATVYGRDYATDLDAFYNDLSLRKTLAYFKIHEKIENGAELSDISGLDETTASNHLECLKNLNLIRHTPNGYVRNNSHDIQSVKSDVAGRGEDHQKKLIQMASLYPDKKNFRDDCLVFATSLEVLKNFNKKLTEAREYLEESSNALSVGQIDVIITQCSALYFDKIKSNKRH